MLYGWLSVCPFSLAHSIFPLHGVPSGSPELQVRKRPDKTHIQCAHKLGLIVTVDLQIRIRASVDVSYLRGNDIKDVIVLVRLISTSPRATTAIQTHILMQLFLCPLALFALFFNKSKTTSTPYKNGSYDIKGGVLYAIFLGPHALFSVEIP